MSVESLIPLDLFHADFGQIDDPRQQGQMSYALTDILFFMICVVISDCNTWEKIEDFGQVERETNREK